MSNFLFSGLTGYGAGEPRRPLSRLSPNKLDASAAALGDLASRETGPF